MELFVIYALLAGLGIGMGIGVLLAHSNRDKKETHPYDKYGGGIWFETSAGTSPNPFEDQDPVLPPPDPELDPYYKRR